MPSFGSRSATGRSPPPLFRPPEHFWRSSRAPCPPNRPPLLLPGGRALRDPRPPCQPARRGGGGNGSAGPRPRIAAEISGHHRTIVIRFRGSEPNYDRSRQPRFVDRNRSCSVRTRRRSCATASPGGRSPTFAPTRLDRRSPRTPPVSFNPA